MFLTKSQSQRGKTCQASPCSFPDDQHIGVVIVDFRAEVADRGRVLLKKQLVLRTVSQVLLGDKSFGCTQIFFFNFLKGSLFQMLQLKNTS